MARTHHLAAAFAVATIALGASPSFAEPLSLAPQAYRAPSIFDAIIRDPAPQAAPYEATEQEETGAAELPANLRRQVVDYPSRETAGTVVIDTAHTYLYYVLGGGKAMRYGIGVGREGFTWAGVKTVERKAEWPDWIPPAEMIARQPYLPRWMAGGPGNPLGARAMYIGGTVYRIHGTNAPSTIGKQVSSGCIRLRNEDVEDLYSRVQVGAKVVVLPGSPAQFARSHPAPQPAAARVTPVNLSAAALRDDRARIN